jgi:hypothetical protein
MKISLSTFILLMCAQLGFAQNLSAQQVAHAFQNSGCLTSQRCQNGYSLQTLTSQQITPQVQRGLVAIAQSQAQIWGDTILEGDFWSDGRTLVQSVRVLKSGSSFVGFHVTYYERAWYTGDCEFNSHRPESLRHCQPGMIVESSFVASRLDDARVDENQFAKFIPRD